jgi:hypothetical protein
VRQFKPENDLGSNSFQWSGFCIRSVWIGLKWIESFNVLIWFK